jgi:hypothetical protein
MMIRSIGFHQKKDLTGMVNRILKEVESIWRKTQKVRLSISSTFHP